MLLLAMRASATQRADIYNKIRAGVKAAMQSLQEKSKTQSMLAEFILIMFEAAGDKTFGHSLPPAYMFSFATELTQAGFGIMTLLPISQTGCSSIQCM